MKEDVVRICEYCGNGHNGSYGSGRFCNSKCSHAYSTINNRLDRNKKISNSSIGNKNFLGRRHSEETKKMLSDIQKRIQNKKFEYIKNNVPFEKWPKRKQVCEIFKENGNICEVCGYKYTNDNGMGPFEIHHIDGNKHNNKRENLQVLCLNCHWKTNNWRFRNKKHSEETKKKISHKIKLINLKK